jgi:hypothetical protein
MPNRTVFFISDGTGITAETFGKAILAQFEMKIRQVRLPFTDTADKAHQAVRQINHTAEVEGCKPIVFTTLVNMEVLQGDPGRLQGHAAGHVRHLRASAGGQSWASSPTTGSAASATPAKARNTTTVSTRSISVWRTTTGSPTATCRAPT